MKAARYYTKGDVRIEDIPEPEVKPGTVKIRVAWCGICGSDLHEYLEGPIFTPAPGHPHPLALEEPPVTLGHEFSGTVEAVGDGISKVKVGDNVVVEPYFVCGECRECKQGNYHLCEKMGFIGLAGGGGGLGEHIVVPERWVHPIGNIPLDEAALIEPLSVAAHAVERSGAQAGDVALIGGAGPIGLLVAAVLKGIGVTTIISELSTIRKARAKDTGVADYVLDPSEVDVAAEAQRLAGADGISVAFECTSVDIVLNTLIAALRPTGVLVNVSIRSSNASVDIAKVVLKELDIRGTIAYRNNHEEVIKLVADGKINVKPFITGRIFVDDLVEQGFDQLINNNESEVKILVTTHPELLTE